MTDLTGLTFGRLLVLAPAGRNKQGSSQSLVQCACGVEKIVKNAAFVSGRTVSCGCRRRDFLTTGKLTHGCWRRSAKRAEYRIWAHIIQRCTNPLVPAYARYGGRGISICQQWRQSFEAFLADVGARPSAAHSLDRWPNNDGNYEPANVRWATRTQQARNKRNNVMVIMDGRAMSIAEAADIRGLRYGLVQQRLKRGWPVDEALA